MNDKTPIKQEAYEGWAIVEIMGHVRTAGLVREVQQFGCTMLRCDTPGPDSQEIIASQFWGGSAIYCLTPCDEAAARKVIDRSMSLPEPVRLALAQADPPKLIDSPEIPEEDPEFEEADESYVPDDPVADDDGVYRF